MHSFKDLKNALEDTFTKPMHSCRDLMNALENTFTKPTHSFKDLVDAWENTFTKPTTLLQCLNEHTGKYWCPHGAAQTGALSMPPRRLVLPGNATQSPFNLQTTNTISI